MSAFDEAAFGAATQQGIAAAAAGDFTAAVSAMQRAIDEAQKLPESDARRAAAYTNLGAVYVRQRAWDPAREAYERAREAAAKWQTPNDALLGDIHVNIGGIALEQGRANVADVHHAKALELWSRALPPDHPKLALLRRKMAPPEPVGTTDGRVVVFPPRNEGWELEHTVQSVGAQRVSLVKCRRVDRSEFFFLLAKDYAVPQDQILPAKTLAEDVYRRNYEKTFADIRYEQTTAVAPMVHEVRLTMRHPSMGAITKRERVIVHADVVLLVSAEGKSEVFERFARHVEDWFARTRFAALPTPRFA